MTFLENFRQRELRADLIQVNQRDPVLEESADGIP